jgi:hypothetical protein
MPRIALIHALAHSVAPVNEAFERAWPEAVRMNLLDDSLSADLARGTGLDARWFSRSATMPSAPARRRSVHVLGVRACIDGRAPLAPPGAQAQRGGGAEATARLAAAHRAGRGRATLASMPAEFSSDLTIVLILAEGASRRSTRATARATWPVANATGVDVVASRAVQPRARVAWGVVRVPVLTMPTSAVRALRARFVRG